MSLIRENAAAVILMAMHLLYFAAAVSLGVGRLPEAQLPPAGVRRVARRVMSASMLRKPFASAQTLR
jgi:hypothetical protein